MARVAAPKRTSLTYLNSSDNWNPYNYTRGNHSPPRVESEKLDPEGGGVVLYPLLADPEYPLEFDQCSKGSECTDASRCTLCCPECNLFFQHSGGVLDNGNPSARHLPQNSHAQQQVETVRNVVCLFQEKSDEGGVSEYSEGQICDPGEEITHEPLATLDVAQTTSSFMNQPPEIKHLDYPEKFFKEKSQQLRRDKDSWLRCQSEETGSSRRERGVDSKALVEHSVNENSDMAQAKPKDYVVVKTPPLTGTYGRDKTSDKLGPVRSSRSSNYWDLLGVNRQGELGLSRCGMPSQTQQFYQQHCDYKLTCGLRASDLVGSTTAILPLDSRDRRSLDLSLLSFEQDRWEEQRTSSYHERSTQGWSPCVSFRSHLPHEQDYDMGDTPHRTSREKAMSGSGDTYSDVISVNGVKLRRMTNGGSPPPGGTHSKHCQYPRVSTLSGNGDYVYMGGSSARNPSSGGRTKSTRDGNGIYDVSQRSDDYQDMYKDYVPVNSKQEEKSKLSSWNKKCVRPIQYLKESLANRTKYAKVSYSSYDDMLDGDEDYQYLPSRVPMASRITELKARLLHPNQKEKPPNYEESKGENYTGAAGIRRRLNKRGHLHRRAKSEGDGLFLLGHYEDEDMYSPQRRRSIEVARKGSGNYEDIMNIYTGADFKYPRVKDYEDFSICQQYALAAKQANTPEVGRRPWDSASIGGISLNSSRVDQALPDGFYTRSSSLVSTSHQSVGSHTHSQNTSNDQGNSSLCNVSLHFGDVSQERIPCLTSAQAKLARVDDLSQMVGPLTEEAIVQILKARFQAEKYLMSIGPSLLLVNPTNQKPFPKVLYGLPTSVPEIQNEISQIVTRYIESGHSQAIILGGYSGSGKTYTSHILLRELYEFIGGGSVTDSFKHVSSALTVIQSLGSASTASNRHASRVGYFLENQISDLSITKTKINCYFLDQARVTEPPPGERNFQMFYQMLAGLTQEEKVKLHLDGYQPDDFRLLPHQVIDHGDLKTSFTTWKASLAELGIPFYDVMRILAAVLLLGNVTFHQVDSSQADPIPSTEASSVAALLGVTGAKLYTALTMRTSNVGGQKVKSKLDPPNVLKNRNSLAKALFTRTLAAIVKRANTMKRPSSGSTISSDSCDSMHLSGQDLLTSTPTKYPGTPKTPSSQHSSNQTGSGFIGIVDMFGFELTQVNRFEQLCINMCSEVLEHIYTTHLFRNPLDCQREEGIEMGIDYIDNTAVVEILSAKRTGLLSILNIETYQQSSPAEFLSQLNSVHGAKTTLFQTDERSLTFTITHYGKKQTYDASSFLDTNHDSIPDDVVCVFAKQNCNFGFVSHLFCGDLRNYSEFSPKGMQHRIAPVPAPEPGSTGHEGKNTLAHDFSMKMDILLKTLGHAKPHFIRCIKSSFDGEPGKFSRDDVVVQLRSLQVLETVHLMTAGYPHRMRYRAFNSKYRFLITGRQKIDDQVHEAKVVLECFLKAMDNSKHPYGSCSWSMGRKYVFLSEGARRQLELLRAEWKDEAATKIQAFWKCWQCARKWRVLRDKERQALPPRNDSRKHDSSPEMNLMPKKDQLDHTDYMLLKKTCQLYGVKLDAPPPLPANRGYTVQGGIRMTFPHMRIMKQDYGEDGNLGCILHKGQEVKITGVKRGFVIVENQGHTMYIPHQLTETKGTSDY